MVSVITVRVNNNDSYGGSYCGQDGLLGVYLNYINVLHMSKHTMALLEQKYWIVKAADTSSKVYAILMRIHNSSGHLFIGR